MPVLTGMFLESARLVGLGAWALFAGVTVGTVDDIGVIAHAIRVKAGNPHEAA